MKALTEKQMHTRLDKYYKKHFEKRDTDAWYVNPAPNTWKFDRDNKTIILVCNEQTGEVTEHIEE